MNKWLALAAGGVAGTFARFLLTGWTHRVMGLAFPYGTLAVNLTGCAIVGFLAAAIDGRLNLGANARLLLVTGFCGAFTTFSALVLETMNLAHEGQAAAAFTNALGSVILGFCAFWAGSYLGRTL